MRTKEIRSYDEKGYQVITRDIGDTEFFAMIDNQVRNKFAGWEVCECLPRADRIFASAGITKEMMEKYRLDPSLEK